LELKSDDDAFKNQIYMIGADLEFVMPNTEQEGHFRTALQDPCELKKFFSVCIRDFGDKPEDRPMTLFGRVSDQPSLQELLIPK
jgi:hypothetical protein